MDKPALSSVYFCIYIVISISVATLAGWQFDIDSLKRVIPGLVAMNPLTALLFIFYGIAFICMYSESQLYKTTGMIVLGVTAFMASIKIGQYIENQQFGIDTLLYEAKLKKDIKYNVSNRMSITTAISFLIHTISLYLYTRRKAWVKNLAGNILILGIFISLLSLIGYIYQVDIHYSLLKRFPMAPHSAMNFMLMSIALLLANADTGIVKEIFSPYTGGILAQKLLPAIIIVPVVLGLLLLVGSWTRLYGPDFRIALHTVGVIILMVTILLNMIRPLNRADAARAAAENELKEAKNLIEIHAKKLDEGAQELAEFSYTISHNLRTPLRALNGYASLLLEKHHADMDEESKHMLNALQQNAWKMGQLMDDLLTFIRIGRMEIASKPIDMNVLVKKVINDLQKFITEPSEISIAPLPKTTGDYGLIRLVYQHLISNAIKYSTTKNSLQISIGAHLQDGKTIYFVQDKGIGFDMRHYDKLFGLFTRLHQEHEFKGMGTGLAVTQRIIHRHGGDIWAQSAPGEGACFYFTLCSV